MIVNDVHYNAYARVVQRLYHLLVLVYALSAVVGVGGVTAFGNVIVLRVVSPVEAFRLAFVNRRIVERRKQMHVRYAELL